MASRKGGVGRWILISLVCLLLATMLCCCSGGILLWMSPSLFLNWFIQDEPLSAPSVAPNPDIAKDLAVRFAADDGSTVQITGEELTQLGDPGTNEELEVFWVDFDDDRFEFVVSVRMDDGDLDGYLNIAASGATTIERGWFTRLEMDSFDLGPMELGQYLVGQELSADANRSMADQRAQDPEVALVLDQIDRLEVKDGAMEITLTPGGFHTIALARGM